MRFPYLAILFLIPLSYCSEHSLPNYQKDTCTIKGKLDNLPDDADFSFAFIGISDLLEGQRKIKSELDAQGGFELSFELERPQDVFFKLGNTNFSLLMEPGNNLEINWKYSDLKRGELPPSLKFSGDGAERNRAFVDMMHDFGNQDFNCMSLIKDNDAIEFANLCLNFQAEQRAFFKNYIRENKIADPLIHKWVNYFATYRSSSDMLGYPIIHAQQNNKRQKELDIPNQYYDFMKEVAINDNSALICSQYLKFLRRDYYIHKRMQTETLPDYKERIEKDGNVATLYNHMHESSNGFAREVILSRLLLDMMEMSSRISEQVPPLLESYNETVKEKVFVQKVMETYKIRYDETDEVEIMEHENLLNLEADTSVLSNLVKRFEGKVIYIDIWATWCSPCLIEMEYYPMLIEKYQDQDLVFVFLAAHSPEKLWKHRIHNFDLDGYQYLLDEKQYYALENYFELKGFPQHVIIDKEGAIVESKGPPIVAPGGKLNNNVVSLLDGLL